MVDHKDLVEKLQKLMLEDEQRHIGFLEVWFDAILAILVLIILFIAVVAFIAMTREEAEKEQMRRSEIWEGVRETRPSEPEQKISEMGRQIKLAFDAPSEDQGPEQKAFWKGKLIEKVIDPSLEDGSVVRKRELSMVKP